MALLVLLILTMPIGPSFTVEAEQYTSPELKLTEVYFNTGPGSEFLTIENQGGMDHFEDISISDGENSLLLPEITLDEEESVTLAEDEGYEEVWDTEPDMVWSEDLQEKVEGDLDLHEEKGKVLLEYKGEAIDSFYYGDKEFGEKLGWEGESVQISREGEYAKRRMEIEDPIESSKEEWTWERRWMVGHSDFEPGEITYSGSAETYVSPDSSLLAFRDFVNESSSRLRVGIYQIDSLKVGEILANVSQQGVHVEILAEGVPVGGLSDNSHHVLSLLEKSGAEVRVINSGSYSPYNFLHGKYMIRDNDSVLISSENFGDTGYPEKSTAGNRGWGIVLEDESVADYFNMVFEDDLRFSDIYTAQKNHEYEVEEDRVEDYNYDPRFDNQRFYGEFEITPFLSPDSAMAEDTILGMIDSAEDSIYVQQFYINHWDEKENPYLSALKDAARGGVEVKVLMDSTWYQMEEYGGENDIIAEEINAFSEKKEVDIEARLLSSYKELIKTHNKGMIVDESKVMVSTINWNANSALQNREVGVIVENEEIGDYYSRVFIDDWIDTIEPIADAGFDSSVPVGTEVTLTGRYSWDDHHIEKYLWDTNSDGEHDRSGKNISLIFEDPGVHEIELYVEDVGGNSDTTTVEIEVKEESGSNRTHSILSWAVLLLPFIGVMAFLFKKNFFKT